MIERPSFETGVAPGQESRTFSESLPVANSPTLQQEEPAVQQQMSRRHLLTLVKVGSGVAATAALVAACSLGGGQATTDGNAPAQAQPTETQAAQGATTGGNVVAHAADVPVNSAHTFTLANQQGSGVLIHLPDQRFVAFNSACTHAQCTVAYNSASKLLECPCHGSVFDPAKNAAVVQGPAQTPLAPVKITVASDGTITLA